VFTVYSAGIGQTALDRLEGDVPFIVELGEMSVAG
jgi:hypothetical protein